MSLACPQCGNSIDQDFGVVTCTKCYSVLFIDFDGNIKTNEDFESPPVSEPVEAIQPAFEPAAGFENFEGSFQSPVDSQPQEVEPAFAAAPTEFQENWIASPEPVGLEPEPAAETEPEAFSSEGEAVYEEIVVPEEPDPNANNFQDVTEFANSDQSSGPLAYTVVIENIDTKDIRQALMEALNDSKFQWDAKELLKKVKMGKLELENLNPVKASILVYRLQDLPVKVRWTQNAYS